MSGPEQATSKAPVSETWSQDRLGREADATFLKFFLLNRIKEREQAGLPASYVLNIDARWGQGKSFFLSRFGQTLRADGFLVAEVNAWQDDHADDPLLSVMDAIDTAVLPLVKTKRRARDRWNKAKRTGAAIAVAAAKGATIQIARKVIGSGVEEIETILTSSQMVDSEKAAEAVSKSLGDIIDEQGKALLDRFREGKRTIAEFRDSLSDFLKTAAAESQPLPLFVLVDELDRCRPPFAIAMLERMKHLFEIDQVVFVVATDTVQLSHSVSAVYGSGFNSQGYLSRFFNRTYYFDRVSKKDFIAGLYQRMPLDLSKLSLPHHVDLATYLNGGFEFFALSLRDVEQVYDILRSVVTSWTSPLKLELAFLFPVTVAHQQKIDLRLDSDFAGVLNRLGQDAGGGNEASWTMQFGVEDHYGRRPPEKVSGVSLAYDFLNQALRGLANLNHEVNASHAQWVVRRLSEEFSIAHHNMARSGQSPLKSVLLQYPDMVRSAGRLLPQVPT